MLTDSNAKVVSPLFLWESASLDFGWDRQFVCADCDVFEWVLDTASGVHL